MTESIELIAKNIIENIIQILEKSSKNNHNKSNNKKQQNHENDTLNIKAKRIKFSDENYEKELISDEPSIWKQAVESANNYKKFTNKECFIQDKACISFINKDLKYNHINLCIDCLNSFNENSSDNLNEECRFIGWRLLKEKNENIYEQIGFLNQENWNEEDDLIWKMNSKDNDQLNCEYELKILNFIGPLFLNIIENEICFREKFKNCFYWKRLEPKCRELCDQCSTTIFNGHFACSNCGLSICLDCYKLRIRNLKSDNKCVKQKFYDEFNWYYCIKYDSKYETTIKRQHKPDELIFVQFIPSYILNTIYFEYKKFLNKNFQKPVILKENMIEQEKNYYWSGESFNQFLVFNSYEENNQSQFELFESEWLNKKPVIIRNLHTKLDSFIWTPQSFINDFGDLKLNLINCRKNSLVFDVSFRQFWLGFDNLESRLCDQKGRPMILKLKDWPTSDDFKTLLPSRFEDLMKNLPIKQYTKRNGYFNLASSLPDHFCLPDLGPKLYIAYSSADTPKEGTTNLHLDISDALNLMIHVGDTYYSLVKNEKISKENSQNINQELLKMLKKSKCSEDQLKRFLNGEKPGALWHIFKPKDADRIRSFLSLCLINKGKQILNENDPIHDQIYYIDNHMLKKLEEDEDVHAYVIVQFLGDAIFIPAGAPHQVRNINSCIKVAEDFVTPQGIDQCLLITDQFRGLSQRHENHQDKLQIKNIIYHSVKRSLSNLKQSKLY